MKSETDETVLIVPPQSVTPAYVLYPHRFYVLFAFSFLSFNQCLIWLTFSPIARSTQIYYGISESTVDLLLNWGPIIFIPCLPLTYILLNKHHGIRRCVILLAIVDFFAAVIRIIPQVITDPSSPHFSSIALPFLHAGQILNAACGPLVMVPVSQLSCLWFAPHERTRATTVAVFANNFGSTVGFVISPYIVSSSDRVPYLLYVHLAFAFVACVLALLYFPAQPPTSGLIVGTLDAWTSLYDIILEPEHYTEKQAGWFGFGSSIAGIVGGLAFSVLADTRRFQHSLKILIVTSLTACVVSILWFELSVHTFFYDKPILPSTAVTIGLSTALIGLFYGASQPLVYEAIAEIMFPLPESLSASILVQFNNIVALILLFIAPGRDNLMNLLVLIIIFACIIMVVLARFSYRRRDEDERKRLEKEQDQILNQNNLNASRNGILSEPAYGTFS
ncbi:unnamed protein product [Adineta steineri]|uniref:Uncharacterized protein n=1 Tax=Adineta steineri TaxID=433720 RepID=A0A815MTR8_9BILA|nr:unnamed protein product [Adineta steineri]